MNCVPARLRAVYYLMLDKDGYENRDDAAWAAYDDIMFFASSKSEDPQNYVDTIKDILQTLEEYNQRGKCNDTW